MNYHRMAYNGLATGLFLSLFPPFWLYSRMTGRYRQGMAERLGFYPESLRHREKGCPRIWVHAASVGEASVALSILSALEALIPKSSLILSTTTEHGRRYAEGRLSGTPMQYRVACVFAPVDLVVTTRRALTALKPDVLACVETELWPNWLMEASRLGIKTALVNGRISVRSIGRYMKIRPLMADALARVDAFSMIREADAQRIAQMGAPAGRIDVNGNAKFDSFTDGALDAEEARIRFLYGVTRETPVFIAGSTRGEEDSLILWAFSRILMEFPQAVLILAPRHIERVRHILQLAKARGLSCQLKTDLALAGSRRKAKVVVLDTIGELQSVYGLADVVFCGGSLVPLGGQNVLEAAQRGKPVLYGPSMEDFLDAKEILDQTGGGIQVKDVADLTENVLNLLRHPEQAQAMGRSARLALSSHRGAARRHADVIHRLVSVRK